METNPSLADRFWSKVDKRGADECWPWIASVGSRGRGYLNVQSRSVRASRIAWELANGRPFPAGLCACHSCDNPSCCNPAHIWAGTQAANLRDMHNKGRFGRRGKKTHCKRGHEFTDANVYLNGGIRNCRVCKRTAWRGKPVPQGVA